MTESQLLPHFIASLAHMRSPQFTYAHNLLKLTLACILQQNVLYVLLSRVFGRTWKCHKNEVQLCFPSCFMY